MAVVSIRVSKIDPPLRSDSNAEGPPQGSGAFRECPHLS
jgi:hypothetical protein